MMPFAPAWSNFLTATLTVSAASADFASNVYFALHEGEKISDYIIGIEVEGDSQVDVGVMNRFSKACKE